MTVKNQDTTAEMVEAVRRMGANQSVTWSAKSWHAHNYVAHYVPKKFPLLTWICIGLSNQDAMLVVVVLCRSSSDVTISTALFQCPTELVDQTESASE